MSTAVATSEPRPPVPGEKESSITAAVLEKVASFTQTFHPVKKIHEHVCGFHFYSHDMTRQVEAHHYCSHLNQDVRQCVIYDSSDENARLIGVEYIISAKLFNNLPEEEKKYWHSHVYEVKSGLLVTPMSSIVPDMAANEAEMKVCEDLMNTFGKTWHLWQVDRGDVLPYGPPQLMMSFVEDGQIDKIKLAHRDEKFKISTEDKRKMRAELRPEPAILADTHVDHWRHRDDGMAWQTQMELVAQKKL
ncbi:hypothetical protein G9A89_013884 [Geosiphon pyriformis]|nr:hypothetical protein G9A89_013884 [Geosiphon pyriformis]